MTIICGYATDKEAVIASDTLLTDDEGPNVHTLSKIWHNKGTLYGFAGSFASGQIVRHAELPKAPTKDFERWGVTKLVPVIYELLKGRESATFIVCVAGLGSAIVDSQFGFVVAPKEVPVVYGSGGPYAMGYLHSAELSREVLTEAVFAANAYDPECGGAARSLEVRIVNGVAKLTG